MSVPASTRAARARHDPGAALSRTAPRLQRKGACACGGDCPRCSSKEPDAVLARAPSNRTSTDARAGAAAPAVVHEALRTGGIPLDGATRGRMETRFGQDFGHVRLHTGELASRSTQAVAARAYTVGSHLVFAAGQYAPATTAGQRLLAHELAHVVQQGAVDARTPDTTALPIGAHDDALEREADALAAAVAGESAPGAASRSARTRVQREEAGATDAAPDLVADNGPAEPADTKPETGDGGAKQTPAPPTPKTAPAEPCDPQALPRDKYLAHAGTSTADFGLTQLNGTVSNPAVRTRKVSGGVVLENTRAAMPAIDSVYTTGWFVEGTTKVQQGASPDCTGTEFPTQWIIDADGAKQLRAAEVEHCRDFKYAFDTSIGRYADIVNRLADSGRTFASEKVAVNHVTRAAGAAPDQWADIFECLAKKTKDRDDLMKWHDPQPLLRPPSAKTNCAHAFSIIHGGSLQRLGHDASEIINGCGEAGSPAPAPAQKKPRRARGEVAKPSMQRVQAASRPATALQRQPDPTAEPSPSITAAPRPDITAAPRPHMTAASPSDPIAAQTPTTAWSSDLLTIVVGADREDCVGMASPDGDVVRYGKCASPIKPPFCQSARVPFKIQFFVDRSNAPISQPFTPPHLRVQLEFVTTGGRQALNIDKSDAAPRYAGANQPLAASFGQDFPVGATESGTLTMRVEMLGVKGMDVIYTDTLEYVISPCV